MFRQLCCGDGNIKADRNGREIMSNDNRLATEMMTIKYCRMRCIQQHYIVDNRFTHSVSPNQRVDILFKTAST